MRAGGGGRVYLDWNASAPLRPEARAAMLGAMDAVGNPSSVHAEGRAARALVERARGQVAALAGCLAEDVIFTSGATEAAALAAHNLGPLSGSEAEHDCIRVHLARILPLDAAGRVRTGDGSPTGSLAGPLALQAANSETGVMQEAGGAAALVDAVQAVGRTGWRFDRARMAYALVSAHKIGGPAGVGALIAADAALTPLHRGGGQELGRRAGTENLVGIAGFGAAAAAALRDLEAGVWARVEYLRIILENSLAEAAPDLILVGQGATRLPNTVCAAVPGWRGETQVMAMDLAGFAVSAGSACSSGKVRESRVLRAMGYCEDTAGSAIRISLGPNTTEAEVRAFADAWRAAYRRRRVRAA